MEEFLPSEVARAVYGYLLIEGCEEAAKTFLETSPNLTECKQRIKQGKRLSHANTLLLGRSLTEVLNIACNVHSLLRQAYEKQQHSSSRDDKELLSGLLDDLRSFVFAEGVSCLSEVQSSSLNKNSQQSALSKEDNGAASHQSVPPSTELPLQQQHTPKKSPCQRRNSFAESYQSLALECGDLFDVSLSPEKSQHKSQTNEILSRPTSAPGALVFPELEKENQSAISAITGFTFDQSQHSITSTPLNPLQVTPTMPPTSDSAPFVVPVSLSTTSVPTCSSAQPTQPISSSTHPIDVPASSTLASDIRTLDICTLPDPPIIVLNSQNQPIIDSTSYFSISPSATSTPHSTTMFNPQDTACIIYPPLITNVPIKKRRLKKCRIQHISSKPKMLLPKPPRKDPPDIIHIQILPQVVEEVEDYQHSSDDTELAENLPKLDDEEHENVDVNSDTTLKESKNLTIKKNKDKENSTENINSVTNTAVKELGEHLTEKPSEFESNEKCNMKETNTPKPCVLKKNISLSTPRRRNSHVRALSFNTPNKPIETRKYNTSPKTPRIKFSPHSSKLNSIKRFSLFKSPPDKSKILPCLTEEDDQDEQNVEVENNGSVIEELSLSKVPIATISPAQKLSNAWKEVNDVTITSKPQWDEKIRSFINGDFIDPAPPPKSESKRKSTPGCKKEPKKKKTNKASPPRRSSRLKDRKNRIETTKKSDPAKTPKKQKTPEKAVVNDSNICSGTIKNNPKVKLKEFHGTNNSKLSPVKTTLNEEVSSSSSENTLNITNNYDISKSNPENKSLPDSFKQEGKIQADNSLVSNKKESSREENGNIQNNNILLDDLGLSSNSSFPQITTETTPITETQACENVVEEAIQTPNNLEIVKSDVKQPEEDATKFLLPNVPVMATPLKEFQIIAPQTPALNTPLMKTIMQETSVLEEDLLLTPSLPPTPLVRSPKQLAITPWKQNISNSVSTGNTVPKKDTNNCLINKEKHTNKESNCINDEISKTKGIEISAESFHLQDKKIHDNELCIEEKTSSKESSFSRDNDVIEVKENKSSANENIQITDKKYAKSETNNRENPSKINAQNVDEIIKAKEKKITTDEQTSCSTDIEVIEVKEQKESSDENEEKTSSKESSFSRDNDVIEVKGNKSSANENIQITDKKYAKSETNNREKPSKINAQNVDEIIKAKEKKITTDEQSSCSTDIEVIEVKEQKESSDENTHVNYKKGLKSNTHSVNSQSKNSSVDKIVEVKDTTMPRNKTSNQTQIKNNTKINSLIKDKTAVKLSSSSSDSSDIEDDDLNSNKSKSSQFSSFESYKYVDANYSSTYSSEEETEDSPDKLKVSPVKINPKFRVRVVQGLPPGTKNSNKNHIHTSPERNVGGRQAVVNNRKNEQNRNLSTLASLILENERRMLDSRSNKIGKKTIKKTRKRKKENNKVNSKESSNKFEKYNLDTKGNDVQPVTPEKIRQQLQLDLIKQERQHIFGDSFPSSTDSETDIDIFEKKKCTLKNKNPTIVEIKKKNVTSVTVSDKSSLGCASERDRIEKLDVIDKTQAIVKSNNIDESSGKVIKNDLTAILSTSSSVKATSKGNQEEDTIKSNMLSVERNNSQDNGKSGNAEIARNKYESTSNFSHHAKETVSSIDANCFADVSSSMDATSPKQDGIEENHIVSTNVISDDMIEMDIPRPPTPFRVSSSEQVAEIVDAHVFLGEGNDEPENHVIVISTTTSNRSNSSLCGLNPDYKLAYEVDVNKVSTLTFSEPIMHLALPSENRASQYQNRTPVKEKCRPETTGSSKVQIGKKRITLTPVGDDKYEQKLKVDYDVIDGKVISKRGDRRLSVDMDVLECTCSTIFDGEVSSSGEVTLRRDKNVVLIGSSKQTTNSDVKFEENSKLIKDKAEELELEKLKYDYENKLLSINNQSNAKNQENVRIDMRDVLTEDSNKTKPNKHLKMSTEIKSNSRQQREITNMSFKRDNNSLNEKSRHRHYEKKKNCSDNEEDKEERYSFQKKCSPQRNYHDRHHSRYLDKRRRDIDRRGYSERRYDRSLQGDYCKKNYLPHSNDRKHDSTKHSMKTSSSRTYDEEKRSTRHFKAEKNKSFVKQSKFTYTDPDDVEKGEIKKNTIHKEKPLILDQEFSDPRASTIVQYSDSEKNESSCDANSLMDFAVMAKTKDSRPSGLAASSSKTSKTCSQAPTSQEPKRKALSDEDNIESKHGSKRLKLDEVDMKEAKSVLKHKMADMLNALHPSTSNQDS